MRQFLLLCLIGFCNVLTAQNSHKITVTIEGYDQPILSLANNVMDKQYIVDTAYLENGSYTFSSDTNALPRGIYLVVLAPNNDYFQMVIGDDEDQEFKLKTSVGSLSQVTAESSEENKLFYEYTAYLDKQGRASQPARKLLQDSTLSATEKAQASEALEAISEAVDAYQQKLINQHPESFTTAIIRTNKPATPPDFKEITEEDKRRKAQLEWLREHYFDNIDLEDDRLLRTPFLLGRIKNYTDRLFVQHPDTLKQVIDGVLSRMDPESELFKFYVVHFTNEASRSNIVGMDALYVHMVDTYYATGRAYWADDEQTRKMTADADKIRPLLIGKQAPNMKMKRRDGTPVELYELDNKYTVLYFWQFACGSCKKSTPVMKEFYAKWKDKGVDIFSVCTKQNEIDKCWEYIDDKEIGDWLHATDRYLRFYRDYDIRSTPTIFVLDENKKIVSKRIGASQLDELLTALEKQKQLEAEGK